MPNKLKVIISGGQTGADRAAWDAAIEAGYDIGGYVPKGRLSEDGPISLNYPNVIETSSDDPAKRTELNITKADGTLIFTHGDPRGGTRLTVDLARAQGKPALNIDLTAAPPTKIAQSVSEWLRNNKITVLNVAGPRASEDPGIYDAVYSVLSEVLQLKRPY